MKVKPKGSLTREEMQGFNAGVLHQKNKSKKVIRKAIDLLKIHGQTRMVNELEELIK